MSKSVPPALAGSNIAPTWSIRFYRGMPTEPTNPTLLYLDSEPDEDAVMRALNQRFRSPRRGEKPPTMADILRDGEPVSRFCAYDKHRVVKSPITYTPGWTPKELSFD